MEHKHYILGRCYLSLILLAATACYAPPIKLTEFTTNSAAAAISALGLGGGPSGGVTNDFTITPGLSTNDFLGRHAKSDTAGAADTATSASTINGLQALTNFHSTDVVLRGCLSTTNNTGSGMVIESSTNAWGVYSNGILVAYCTTNGSIVVQSGSSYVQNNIAGTIKSSGLITCGGLTAINAAIQVGAGYALKFGNANVDSPDNWTIRLLSSALTASSLANLSCSNVVAKGIITATNGLAFWSSAFITNGPASYTVPVTVSGAASTNYLHYNLAGVGPIYSYAHTNTAATNSWEYHYLKPSTTDTAWP